MNPTPSPSPVDVFVHTGPAEWWQIVAALGPLAVLLGAVLAAVIGWHTLRQRTIADAGALAQQTEADSRAEWWRRAQWAFDAALDDKLERQDVGLAVLELLSTSDLAGMEEAQIIAEAWKRPLQDGEATSAVAETKTADEGEPTGHVSPAEGRVIIRAARLRLATDKKQGIESPSWVKNIAKRPL